MNGESDARLYGSAIALTSGLYAVLSALAGPLTVGGWAMLLLGVVVLVHGVVLLTDAADVEGLSGPLMVVWGVLMLLNQALVGVGVYRGMHTGMGGGMDGGMGGGPMGGAMGTAAWDPGMVALAALMVASGLVMARS